MLKRFQLVCLLIILLMVVMVLGAQEENLTAEELLQFEPVAILGIGSGSGLAVGSEGQFELRSTPITPPLFQLQLFNQEDGTLVYDFGPISQAELVNDSFLLWVGIPQSQPQLFSLDELAVVGEFPAGSTVYPQKQGEGFFYTSANTAYYQSSDFSEDPITLVSNLGYTEGYTGDLEELPDGHTVLIAGMNGTILYDMDTASITSEIAYPLAQSVSLSADGTRLSAITNYDVFSSQASNWIAYDLTEGEVLVELYGERGSHGIISESGNYAAASQLVTDSRMGVLHIYDLNTGEEVVRVENISHGGIPGQIAFLFVGDRLVFIREWNGQTGFLSVYDPSTDEMTELDIPVMLIIDALYGWFDAPVLSDTTAMIEVNTLEAYSIFDVESLELVRSFPSHANYDVDSNIIRINIGNTATTILYALPDDERPALPSLAGVTQSDNINVRVEPSTNGERLTGASGAVIAIGRNADSTWVLLSSHGGWVSADLVTLDGDVEILTVVP